MKKSNKKFSLDIPKMGYFLLLRHDKGLFGDIIKAAQIKKGFNAEQASFTHVEVSGGGQWSVCVAHPYTSVIDITKRYKGRYVKIMSYIDYSNNPSDVQYHKRYKVAFWAASNCNLRYDFKGVIGFVFRTVKNAKNLFFCSENSLWALQKEFPDALDIEPEDCMPAHFCNKAKFSTVWEGIIN
jgi:hypothetical protein